MGHTATHVAESAANLIEQEGGFTAFVQNVLLGGIAYQAALQVIEGIGATGYILMAPVRALGKGIVLLVSSTIGNMVAVVDAGTAATILSFTDGTARLLGPLAQPTAVGIAMLSLGVFIMAVNRLSISPLSFLQSLRN